MALYKEIMQDDGVVTCYHRILYHQTTPNRQTSIAVLSYVNDRKLERPKKTRQWLSHIRKLSRMRRIMTVP